MSISVIPVTPELATEWLKANTPNRNLNARVVNDYARDMVNDKWIYNGEAIKRASDSTDWQPSSSPASR